MLEDTMIYKIGTGFFCEGASFDYDIVKIDPNSPILPEGWFLTTTQAKEAKKLAEVKPIPTREELEQKATELGIPFNTKTSNKKLNDLINLALSE